MHSYHIFFQKGRGLDWSLFVKITGKNPKIPLTVLFFLLPPPFFLQSLSFTIHYMCVTGSRRVERGEQCVVTLSTALKLSAWLQLLLPAGRGGGPGHRPSARLPSPGPPLLPPPPESIALWHHTNDPPKSMHHSTVHHQQWLAMWFRSEKEGARIRWKVLTGKYKIKGGKEKQERCGSKTRKMKKQTMCTYCS